jgi:hypothetical protein
MAASSIGTRSVPAVSSLSQRRCSSSAQGTKHLPVYFKIFVSENGIRCVELARI